MKKILPYLYIVVGAFIIIGTINSILQDKSTYRVILNFHTENKFIFLIVRALFASWFLFDGIKKLRAKD